MAAIRAHYATGIGGTGPQYYDADEQMGSWFIQNAPGWVTTGQFACMGMVTNMPHWPPYWAQVWGDVVLRSTQSSGTSQVDLLMACSWWYDGTPPDEDLDMGYRMKGEVLMQSFAVTGTAWTTFQIPVREMMLGNPIRDSEFPDSNNDLDYDNPTGYWLAPLVYHWSDQTYFPWLRVNSGPSIEVKMLRLWDQATCANDDETAALVTHRISVPGVVDNFRSQSGPIDPVVWGSGSWNDTSDATYASFGYSNAVSTSAYGVLEAYTGGVLNSLTLHFRVSASGDTRAQPMTAHILRGSRPSTTTLLRFYGGSTGGRWAESWSVPINFMIPNDNIARSYSCRVDAAMLDGSGWDTLDEMRSNLAAGGCGIFFDSDDFAGRVFGDPHAVGTIRIYEAYLIVESPT